ncbi:EF-hand domain-containing protein [Sneathiella limimaris]|uniref:EF-hand domain-containing protein n=1 Tax=Sneathiella limimaris TaxID=1964213 RepID=UPI00146EB8BD|nr:EF-hand domain-containing protein [Sneathiella limimaris]
MKRTIIVSALIAAVAIPTVVFAAKHGDRSGDKWIEYFFEKHDANKDGQLSKDEMPTRFQNRFDEADKNSDGVLSKDEAIAAHQERKEKHITEMMMRFDTDSNGLVSEPEIMAFVSEKFKEADLDGDGSLSKEEILKMGPMMRKGHHMHGKH